MSKKSHSEHGFSPEKSRAMLEKLPPLASLLDSGLPSQAKLSLFIDDLDAQLEKNTKKLEACQQEILGTCNSLPGNRQYSRPREAINNLLNAHIIDKDSCYDPETEDVLTILSHMSVLEHNPGSEELVLEDLLSLSSEEGLSLPLSSRHDSNHMQSVTSVNAVADNVEFHISQQWDQIALHMRRYFTGKLQTLPMKPEKLAIDLFECKRIQYLQSLLSLYPSDDILIKYQTLRSQQLEKCFQTLLPEGTYDQCKSVDITKNCHHLASIILRMIDEDFLVFNSGIFKKSFNIARAMHDMYLEKFSDEMSALVEDIWEEIEEIFTKKRHTSTLEGSEQRKRVKLQRGNNADDLDHAEQSDSSEDQVAMETSIPKEYIESMLEIVTSIIHIEEHVESLLRCAAWDTAGVSSKKVKRKGSLRGVLKTSSSPELPRRPHSYTSDDTSFSESLTSSFGSPPSSLLDMSANVPKVVERTRGEERLRWEWRLMFKKFAQELSQCVDKQIRNKFKTSMDRELQEWIELNVLVTEKVREDLVGGKLDYPKATTKSVQDFMAELDLLLPLARTGTDGSVLQCVRTSFVDAASLCLHNFHVHLTKLSSDIPKTAPVRSLYALLSNAAYIRNHLLHYEAVLTGEDTSKKMFSGLYKNYVELVDSLSKLTLEIHNNFISTSILHDTDSYNWLDNKEFHEGERCSYPIQMWNYHMRGLQYDLWTICPPRLGQNIYTVILHNSLQVLAQRYSHSKPSYRRTEQLKNDVVSILLCISELLLPACTTMSMYFDVGSSQQPHHNIQNFCSNLLATMAVICAPLETLYNIFKRGFHQRPDFLQSHVGSPTTEYVGSNTDWLSWIQPSLLQPGQKSYAQLRTTTALYLHCKLLLYQPEVDWAMLVQALLMKDLTLPILFLTQTVTASPTHPREDTPSKVVNPDVKKLFTIVTRTLLQCKHHQDSLARVIVPVVTRSNQLNVLDSKTVPGRDLPVPVWLDTIMDLLQPFFFRVLKPVLTQLLMGENTASHIKPILSIMSDLPCGCHPKTSPTKPPKGDGTKELNDKALMVLLGQISEDIHSIPSPLCILFKSLEEQCSSHGIKTPHQCVGLKVLGSCLLLRLTDRDYIERMTGVEVSDKQDSQLKLLGECIYYILVSTKAKSNATPKLAGKFCKENKEWTIGKVQAIGGYLKSSAFGTEGIQLSQEGTNLYNSQQYALLASDILDSPHGKKDLLQLHGLIANNLQWLELQFDIQQVLPRPPGPTHPHFVLDFIAPGILQFDPTIEFERIGTQVFDHKAIQDIEIGWDRLLHSDLGLSEYGFRSLLYNRHEMQEGAYLEENEKKPIEILKAVYENEPRELE
ncbi:hypothetical protein FSP39_012501 [Pinctada imbricata]|uniref:KIAA0825 n=1 Tax=Pinctada imbricata TaxID=66713 RepID=A0AA88Y4B8_PINIB|nr:hypothetical protein FSP39_012501 [Pinctada imbricata]